MPFLWAVLLELMLLMKKITIILFFLTYLLSQCAKDNSQDSTTKFERLNTDQIMGTVYSRLEVLRQSLDTNIKDIKVCVQLPDNAPIGGRQLLYETKLAFVLWLSAGGYTESDWSRFNFELYDSCAQEDNHFSVVVYIADNDRNLADKTIIDQFHIAKAECKRDGDRGFSCEQPAIKLGRGGPNGIEYEYDVQTNQWIRLSFIGPSSSIFSQHIDWISISEQIKLNKNMSISERNKLIQKYNEESNKLSQSFEQLQNFGNLLTNKKFIGNEDSSLAEILSKFGQSTDTDKVFTYRKKIGLFHTLLHEIGHQFGLLHADAPSDDGITGKSLTTVKNENGDWVTEHSIMAYGDQYYYLTDDDLKGANNTAQYLSKRLKEVFTPSP